MNFSELGFTVEKAPPPVVQKDWKQETSRDAWWSELHYEPKEGDVNCRVSKLDNGIHATIVKGEVPLVINLKDTPEQITATLLGPSFHVTIESGKGNSVAHYFYKTGASPSLQNLYPHRLQEAKAACENEYDGIEFRVRQLLT